MVSANDPNELISESFQLVRNGFFPLELGLRRAAKDLETRWGGKRNKRHNLESMADSDVLDRNAKVNAFGMSNDTAGIGIGTDVECCVREESKRGFFIKLPIKPVLKMFTNIENGHGKSEGVMKVLEMKDLDKDSSSCSNCLHFAMVCPFWVKGFLQGLRKKKIQRTGSDDKEILHSHRKVSKLKISCDLKKVRASKKVGIEFKERKEVSLECFVGFIFNQITQNLQKLDQFVQESALSGCDWSHPVPPSYLNGFLGNLKFARVGGLSSSIVGLTSSVNEATNDDDGDGSGTGSREELRGFSYPQKLASGILSIPLSNVERLRSTLSTISLTELVELLPQLGRPSADHPDKKKLISVQDFFRYTEAEGRRFFEELDRDGDGQVRLEDLEIAMSRRKLSRRYAKEFMRRSRSHMFSKSFGWKQFLSLMEQKEPTILRAYTSLCLSKSGTLQKSEILASLKNAGLPASEENAVAMMRFLNADTEGSISYGHFRNFMLLLPSERLQDDPRSIWFEAATVVAVAPPMEIPTGSVLRSALAGGLASAVSTFMMYPIDTIKTRVQVSSLSFPEVISKIPQIGAQGLYRGSIPAILGQFSSHGLRTGIFEASKLVLVNVAPTLPDIQVQSMASFCSTFLGTAVRIPCEVLKQRLQAGLFNNVGEAIVGTWQQDGLKGFFRGTGATLCREVPLYVAGMGLYSESKKIAQKVLGRELEAWEMIGVGALSGGLAAVVTTPFDVMKTRMMTAPQGRPISMSMVVFSVLRNEGPLGLFKGAEARFFWVAPMGAMNFAGYELARKAMDKNNDLSQNK